MAIKAISIATRLIRNIKNSWGGLKLAARDWSFRAELALGVTGSFFLVGYGTLNSAQYLVIGLTYTLLLSAELFNTAIERLCDRITLAHDPAIGAIKDLSSAAVFLILIVLMIELVIFL